VSLQDSPRVYARRLVSLIQEECHISEEVIIAYFLIVLGVFGLMYKQNGRKEVFDKIQDKHSEDNKNFSKK
jgi:hypothetical protein